MTLDEIEHRVEKAEEDIKHLYSRTNKFSEEMAAVTTKLDNILVTLGELKANLLNIQNRPAKLWDKLIFGVLSAAAAAIVTAVFSAIH